MLLGGNDVNKVMLVKYGNYVRHNRCFIAIKSIVYYLLKNFVNDRIEMPYEKAVRILSDAFPSKISSSIRNNEIKDCVKFDLQIIVPAYNVEKYIKECVDSLLNQKTDYKYQIVVVDDGSTDNTGKILDSYAVDERIMVIHQKNGGISSARNRGLEEINAEFVMFVDSDDFVTEYAVQRLLETAYRENADVVEGAYSRLYYDNQVKTPYVKDVVKTTDTGCLYGMPWGKVYRNKLFRNVCFPGNAKFEDSIVALVLFQLAERIYQIPDYIYIYRIIENSMTHGYIRDAENIDTWWVTDKLSADRKMLGVKENLNYAATICRQIMINYSRVSKLSIDIQKAVFACTYYKYEELLRDYEEDLPKYKDLVISICKHNFGGYSFFCKLN